nr:hypothetical protein [Tanacetum cinerariifolium]
MKADNSKYEIIAFDLSTKEFTEIPQPPDLGCNLSSRLGIIDGCLCIFYPTIYFGDRPIWVMKTYKVKSSWTLLPPYAIHTLKCPKDDYVPHTSFFTDDDDDKIELRYKESDLCAPMFVHSLVSPHVYRRLKRKRRPTNNHKLAMVLSTKNVVPDTLESILVRLDVKDLIRCKNVLANPSTRQFRLLPNSHGYVPIGPDGYDLIGPIGFGYDSFSDDYKLVLGSRGGPSCTSFIVFSLKTNAWRHAGQFGCSHLVIPFVGAFCNGAIHWFMKADNSKYVIIAFDLSTEEFKEIPQPPGLDCTVSSRLGIIDGCLCICHPTIYFWLIYTPTIDLSSFGLEEFKQPEFESYRPKASKSVCVETSNVIKKAFDAPIIEDSVSDCDEDESKEMGKSVTSVVGKQRTNVVKSSECWVWRPKIKVQDHVSKNSRSYICKRFDYVDPEGKLNGCSRHMTGNKSFLSDYQEYDGDLLLLQAFLKGRLEIELKGYLLNNGYADLVQHDNKKELAIPGQMATGKEFSNPLVAGSLPKTISAKFWNTASSKTVNSVKQIHAIVDGKAIVISESLVRSDLLFDDEDGITCLTKDEIFENLALMSYEPLSTKLTFQKEIFNDTYEIPCHTKKVFSNMARKSVHFSRNITPLFNNMLVQNQAPKGEGSAIPPEPQPTPFISQPPAAVNY